MSWLQTQSGKRFWPLDPRVEDVEIADIAHALSQLCRFAGHTREFYSVAQHSVLVCETVTNDCRLWGLLHDAAEAYMSDVPKPLKEGLPDFQRVERRLEATVAAAFGLRLSIPQAVKRADLVVLLTEKRDLITPGPWRWGVEKMELAPLEEKIIPWSPRVAKAKFMYKFRELTDARTQDV